VKAKGVAIGALAAVLVLALGEVAARKLAPREPGFAVDPEIHPLLGEAPVDSFARQPDGPLLRDLAGRPFALAKLAGRKRVLLLGGTRAAAASLPDALARATGADVIQGARAGYLPVQAFFVYAAFGRAWSLDSVVVVDGLEIRKAAPPYVGFTPAWTRHRRALAHPLIASLSERSRLFDVLIGEPVLGPTTEPARPATDEDVARAANDARALSVLTEADKVPLAWITVGDASQAIAPAKARAAVVAASASDDDVAAAARKLLDAHE
jgi:hypothetical protein